MDDTMVSEQFRNIAEEHCRAGRYAEAVRLYQKLKERHPDDDSYALALAWAYHDNGQIESAIACFESLFEKELSRKVFTGFAFDELVRIFKRLGLYDRLLLICEKATAAQPWDYALLGDLGDACLRTGRADRAAAVYRQMIEMEPEASVVYCSLGNALIVQGDFVGAEAAYERAIAIEPEKVAPYYGRLADQYQQAGHIDRAVQAIRKGLEHDAAEPAYQLILGDLLIAGGNVKEGWLAYESAVERGPASAGAYYYRLGNTLSKASRHEQAVEAFHKAIMIEPQNPFYFLNLAASYRSLGWEGQALEALRQAEDWK